MEIQKYQTEIQKRQAEIIKANRIPTELLPATTDQALKLLATLPKQLYKTLTPKTTTEIFISPYPSVATIKKELGLTLARAITVIMITDVCLFFNTGQNMNQDQIADLADILMEEHYWLKIDDFKLCFNNGKKGRYGEVFRIDGGVLLSWIEKYIKDRLNDADESSYVQHNSTQDDIRHPDFESHLNKLKKW